MMSDETTTEQLVEIEGQAESTAATKYTPPDGWRVLQVGELLLPGDQWVNWEGTVSRPDILHGDGTTASGGRYIRPIEPEPVQVREGRWRTRGGEIKNIRPCEPLKGAYYVWPWTDGFMTYQDNGLHQGSKESPNDLIEYLGPIEEQPETQQNGLVRDVTHLLQESGVLDSAKAEQQIEELRSEVSFVQRLLGESRQRVTQLEELVASLRTINEGAEKAVSGAGVVNDSLRLQLAAVKAELASVAADRQQLRVELDAAQQVPADSPELRQLRADLEQVTLGRDTYQDGYNRVLSDLETIRETTKAETVEAIAEWLQAFRGCNSPALALLLVEALPSIMRSLTGLEDEEIE